MPRRYVFNTINITHSCLFLTLYYIFSPYKAIPSEVAHLEPFPRNRPLSAPYAREARIRPSQTVPFVCYVRRVSSTMIQGGFSPPFVRLVKVEHFLVKAQQSA